MSFLAFGINHKTAPVDIREQVAFDPEALEHALLAMRALPGVDEAAILSTCNRTELYCSYSAESAPDLLAWLATHHQLNPELIKQNSFVLRERKCVEHVMRVAAGLDSLVLGEPQILGQLKAAYAAAVDAETVGGALGRLFEQSFAVAKRIRTETAIGENPVSVAAAAVNMARQLFADFSENNALLLGAGRTTELVARHLKQAGIRKLTIANRTLARAQALAKDVAGHAALLAEAPDLLIDADIVISSTASSLPVLGKGAVERALKARKHRPIFMVDIAVPRDIEPQVAELDDVFLYTVDDLKEVIDENLKSRQQAASEAEQLVKEGATAFLEQLRAAHAGDRLRRFRTHAEQLQQIELEKALRALRAGGDAEQVLRSLSRGLTNKLIHEPTVHVRNAAASGDLEAGRKLLQLFGLDPDL
ncbi:MAG: glutamyl-tRNA reductase [Oleiphilaceae bacterium]|nr:glutamyl-tRNA reductase [Oleiphilaceae bacterium]